HHQERGLAASTRLRWAPYIMSGGRQSLKGRGSLVRAASLRRRCDRNETRSGHADVDQIVNQLEVVRVQGQQRHTVNVRSGGDRQIEGAASRLAAALRHGCIKASALARRCRLEGQRFEAFLDRS